MSLDLSFWKYEVQRNDHSEVYAKLSDGEAVDGVSVLPIDEIKEKLFETFGGWNRLDDTHLDLNGSQMIEIFTTNQFVRFDCYGVSEDNMNRLIDLMLSYDCRLYDSSINVRFD